MKCLDWMCFECNLQGSPCDMFASSLDLSDIPRCHDSTNLLPVFRDEDGGATLEPECPPDTEGVAAEASLNDGVVIVSPSHGRPTPSLDGDTQWSRGTCDGDRHNWWRDSGDVGPNDHLKGIRFIHFYSLHQCLYMYAHIHQWGAVAQW